MKTQVKVVNVTKKLVDSLLAKNERNRPINAKRVASLVRAIKDGKWRNNGSTITLDGNGFIMDGQHRLAAIKQAGYPSDIELIIIKYPIVGEERDNVFYTMNCSRPSSTAQVFQYNSIPNANAKAACCRFIAMVYYGMGFEGVPNRDELWECYNLFKNEVDVAVSFSAKKPIVRFLAPMMAAFAIVAHAHPKDDRVWELAHKVSCGANLRQKSVEHTFFKYCNTLRTGHIGTCNQKEQFFTTLNAIYTYLDTPEKSIVRIRPTEQMRGKLLKRAMTDAQA